MQRIRLTILKLRRIFKNSLHTGFAAFRRPDFEKILFSREDRSVHLHSLSQVQSRPDRKWDCKYSPRVWGQSARARACVIETKPRGSYASLQIGFQFEANQNRCWVTWLRALQSQSERPSPVGYLNYSYYRLRGAARRILPQVCLGSWDQP